MKPIAIIAIIAAVVVVGGACAGVAFSGVLNGGTTGPGGDDPVVPTEPVEPTPTETPTETPTDSSMSYFSPMTSSGSSSSGSGGSSTTPTPTPSTTIPVSPAESGNPPIIIPESAVSSESTISTTMALPEGYEGDVILTPIPSNIGTPEGSISVYMTVDITLEPELKESESATINFEIPDSELNGYAPTDVVLYHYGGEPAGWTPLVTTYNGESNGEHSYTATAIDFSPYAVVFVEHCEHAEWVYSPADDGKSHTKTCGICNRYSEIEDCTLTYAYNGEVETHNHKHTKSCGVCPRSDIEDCDFNTPIYNAGANTNTKQCKYCPHIDTETVIATVTDGSSTVGYPSVAEAIENAGDNEVTLVADMSAGETIDKETLVVINPAGHKILLDFTAQDGNSLKIKSALGQDSVIKVKGTVQSMTVDFSDTPNTDGYLVVDSASSSDDKYLDIYTSTGLTSFGEKVNGGTNYIGQTVSLMNTLDLAGQGWTPIGKGVRSGKTYIGTPFNGIFDGNAYEVKGLSITTTDGADAALGLFGVVDGGTVKNVTITANINVPDSEMAGGAVGMLTEGGTVEKVTVSGTVSAKRGNGGIVGRMTVNGTIKDCINNAVITSTGANVGGIVGAAYYNEVGKTMKIENCVNNGAVTGTSDAVGGIVGLSCADVSNCVNNGVVTGNGADVAGIVAEQQNAGSVTGCTNNADITNNGASGDYGTGGIIGWIRYSGKHSNYQIFEMIEVTGNTNNGNVTSAANDAGGIVGTVYNTAVVTGNTNKAQTISATNFAAGIVGNVQFTEIAGGELTNSVTVSDNISTTPIESITATNKDLYVYDNSITDVTKENNRQN